ncbi:hypothetical protein [Cytobacillus praedii]|uniref:hypothetical protein n=1 Tax=Cytobacillus praedii TaxID=1742358 RepID=UPI002E1EE38C|nr:hypothetical protein [Cytobacillus praedii]
MTAFTLRKQLFNLRELVLLQKICATNEGADVLREAISVFAGNGVMEEFLPCQGFSGTLL